MQSMGCHFQQQQQPIARTRTQETSSCTTCFLHSRQFCSDSVQKWRFLYQIPCKVKRILVEYYQLCVESIGFKVFKQITIQFLTLLDLKAQTRLWQLHPWPNFPCKSKTLVGIFLSHVQLDRFLLYKNNIISQKQFALRSIRSMCCICYIRHIVPRMISSSCWDLLISALVWVLRLSRRCPHGGTIGNSSFGKLLPIDRRFLMFPPGKKIRLNIAPSRMSFEIDPQK